MDENQKKLLDVKYRALPTSLKRALESDTIEALCAELSERFNLNIDAPDKLDDTIRLTLLGLSDPKDFIRKMSAALNVDGQIATSIAQIINDRIFRPVRDELKVLYNIPDTVETTPPLEPAAAKRDLPLTWQAKPRTLSAELEENIGLHPPPPPPPPPPHKPIDAELQEVLRRPPAPPPPPLQQAQGRPPAPPPPPLQSRPSYQGPQGPALISRTDLDMDLDMKPPQEATGYKPEVQRPVPPPAPPPRPIPSFTPPAPPPMPTAQTFEPAPPVTEDEENLSRDEILRGIEDPTKIGKDQPRYSLGTPPPSPPQQYDTDPYREPTE